MAWANNRVTRFFDRHPFSTAVITVLIILVPGYVVLTVKTNCATTYAQRNFERNEIVAKAQNEWIATLDRLILASPPLPQKVALAEFRAAAAKFDQVRDANPITDTKPAHC